MLVTRGLGRNGSAGGALLATFGLGRQLLEQLHGKLLRTYQTTLRGRRWRRKDLEQAPITTRKEFARRVREAIEGLKASGNPAAAKRAERIQDQILRADSARRRSILQVNFNVLLAQFDRIEWLFDAYEQMRERRRRDDEAILALIFSSL